MAIIFKPKRCSRSGFEAGGIPGTPGSEPLAEGELIFVKNDISNRGIIGNYSIYVGTDGGGIVKEGQPIDLNWTTLDKYYTSETTTEWGKNLNLTRSNIFMAQKFAHLTKAVSLSRLIWTSAIQQLSGSVTVNCSISYGDTEKRKAILITVEVEASTLTSSGPIQIVTIPDPLNFITTTGTTYRGGYYQNDNNGGGAYVKLSKSGNNVTISLDQVWINGTPKSSLTGQFRVKTLYEKYSDDYNFTPPSN